MANKTSFIFTLFSLALIPASLPAQETAAIPQLAGVYYQATSGWLPMRSTLFMPIADGGVRQFFSVGRRQAVVDMPGPSSPFRIPNARPTFAVRGLSPATGLYLVKSSRKATYRQVRMPVQGPLEEWARFRSQDLNEIELEPLTADVVRVRPRADLAPGEYVLVSDLAPQYRAVRLGFEFAVTGR